MSIDGKVTGEFLNHCDEACLFYYQINRDYHADGFICGRVTMESSFTGGYYPNLDKYQEIMVSREDYVADSDARYFAIAYDRYGKLGWKTSRIIDEDPGYGNAHIIEVLTEKVSDAYLAYLQEIGVSYIFAGKDEIDISLSLEKLNQLFGVNTLLLEGGSIINGAFLKEDVVDELSLVIAPLIAGNEDKPLFMDADMNQFQLTNVNEIDGICYLNYKKI